MKSSLKKIRRFLSVTFFLLFSASIACAIYYAFAFEGFSHGLFMIIGGMVLFWGGAMVAHLIQGCNGRTLLCDAIRCERSQQRLRYDF